MKISRFLPSIIAVSVLAFMVAYLAWVEFPRQKAKEEKEDSAKKVFSFAVEDVVKISLQNSLIAGECVISKTDEKNAPSLWVMESPVKTYAERVAVENILRDLENLRKTQTIESSDLKMFGLDLPSARAKIELKDGAILELSVGEDAGVEQAAYATTNEKTEIILIDKFVKTNLMKDIFSLREKRAVNFDKFHLKEIEIKSAKEKLSLSKKNDDWTIDAPRKSPAEKSAADDFIYALSALYATEIFSENAAPLQLKAKGLDAPTLHITLTEKIGDEVKKSNLSLSKTKDSLYALREWDGAILTVQSDRWDDLNLDFSTARRKSVFTLPKWEISRIDIAFGEEKYTLSKKDWQWEMTAPESAKPDHIKTDDLLTAIIRLKASDLSDKSDFAEQAKKKNFGFENPILKIIIAGDDGEEEAIFGKSQNNLVYCKVSGWEEILLVREESLSAFKKPRSYLLEPSEPPEFDVH